MKEKYLLIFTMFIFYCLLLNGQDITPVDVAYFDKIANSTELELIQTPKLENYVENWVGLNKKRRGFYGYRVKIFSELGTHARNNANNVRLECKKEHPEVSVYVVYNDPNFEVHVGDFRSKFEAMALLSELKPTYSEAFVVYGIIEFPELPEVLKPHKAIELPELPEIKE